MNAPTADHVTFWRALADALKAGRPLVEALTDARKKLGDSALAGAAGEMIAEVGRGEALSSAMAGRGEAFSRCARTMVRAGEAGGVLDVVAGRVADALAEGSFPTAAGAAAGQRDDDPERFWRAFGRLLSSGVPLGRVLGLLADEVAGPGLAAAAGSLREAVENGATLASAMRGGGEAFPAPVIAAVAAGEADGELDMEAFRIADALAAGRMPEVRPSAGGAAQAEAEGQRTAAAVTDLLAAAVGDGVSDIHLDPAADGPGRVRRRVDGVLHELPDPPADVPALVARLKAMAAMDVAERRLPQDGMVRMALHGRDLDLRVSTLPTRHGERLVVRIFQRTEVALSLDALGLAEPDLAAVRRLCRLPAGMVIAAGPTGSGMTTLLYAMLAEINAPDRCLITIEDPIEYEVPGVAQVQVDPRIGLTFTRGLVHALRQAPNVIMVGELRDLPTARMAAQAAMTGHLLLSTMHTNDAPSTIRRLLDVGVEPYVVNAALRAVVATRLVRVLCPDCRRPVGPPARHTMPPEAVRMLEERADVRFFAPAGCPRCHGSGFRGRTAVCEVLVLDDGVREAVAAAGDLDALRDAARAAGARPLMTAGLQKAAEGVTSIEEVVRVAPWPPDA